jgi:formyltetrahydrofolate deformylase
VPTVEDSYVITFGCPDRTGIVARIAGFLADAGGWIVEAAYHTDPDTGWFFTRQVVRAGSLEFGVDELRARFGEVAASLSAESSWKVDDTSEKHRVVILVSKEGHCLYDLLGRVAAGELDVDVRAVIGNHESLGAITRAHGIPFHHVPFPASRSGNGDDGRPGSKSAAFDRLRKLVDEHEPHAVVLARFMQVLPIELCEAWAGRALNIHHSFLPSFVGAKPYHQAHQRGVKLVGATCHYVTANLDAGPIIEQDVIRVDHGDSVQDMVRKGRDIEKVTLARGLRWHLESRVLVHGSKTVVL